MRSMVVLMAAWILIVPPEVYDAGMLRRNDRMPLATWERLGQFEDAATCQRARDDRAASLRGRDDVEWARWSLARCFTAKRASGGSLSAADEEQGL